MTYLNNKSDLLIQEIQDDIPDHGVEKKIKEKRNTSEDRRNKTEK